MQRFLFIIFITNFILFSFSAYAQQEQEKIQTEEIFVTGKAVPVGLNYAGVGTAVISQEQISAIKPNSIDELLRTVTGISIYQNGAGKTTSLSIRGGDNRHTLILLDGTPIKDPTSSSGFDISSIPVSNIERIEIVKGPAAAAIGGDALNGAINIITKKGGEKPLQADIAAQSSLHKQNFAGLASLYGSKGMANYRISMNYLYDENVSAFKDLPENDPNSMANFSAYLNLKPVDDLSTSLQINYTDRQSEIDGYDASFNKADLPDEFFNTQRANTIWKTKYIVKNIWEPVLTLSHTYTNRETGNIKTLKERKSDYFKSNAINLNFLNNFYILDAFVLSFGLDYEYNTIDTKSFGAVFNKDANYTSIYLQGNINLFDAWNTVITIRGQKDNEYDFIPSYNIASVYDITMIDLQLKASFGTGVLSPTLYHLYDITSGNKDLKQEQNISYEVGFSNGLFDKKIVYGLSWFDNYYDNLIQYVDLGNFTGMFYNVAKAHMRGIEANIIINPIKYISFGANYTWLQTFDTYEKPLARKPEHQVTAFLNIKPIDALNIYMEAIYNGKSTPSAYDPVDFTGEYYLINAAIGYDINENMQVYLKGSNLTNNKYEEVSGYGTKGIEIFAGLKAKF